MVNYHSKTRTDRARIRAYPAALHGLVLGLLTTIFLALPTWEVEAGQQPSIDAVILMDSSGSMRKNDPKRLRIPAAKMFISLLGQSDRVSVVSFSDAAYPVAHLTPVSGKANRDKLFRSVDQVSARGAFTNLEAALSRGEEILTHEGSEDNRRIIILLSDGAMDVGDAGKDRALVQKIRDERLAALSKKGIEAYSIAFTKNSDLPLMEQIAAGTGGLFCLASTDADLHKVFSTIFEKSKAPDMLPIEGGEFMVDSSVEEVNIVASKATPDAKIALVDPDGKRYRAKDGSPNLRWFSSAQFDIVTLRKPVSGTWRLLSSAGQDKAYVVTNMGLGTNVQDAELELNSEAIVEAWLERDGQAVTHNTLLDQTEFSIEVEQPDGTQARYSLFAGKEEGSGKPAKGVYSDVLRLYKEGTHKLNVIAKGKTFQREKAVFFKVNAPLVAVPVAEPVQEIAAAPEPVPEPKPETVPEPEPVKAEEVKPEAPKADEPKPVEEKVSGRELLQSIFLFIAGNLALVLIGFGTYMLVKFIKARPKKPKAKSKTAAKGKAKVAKKPAKAGNKAAKKAA